MNTRLQGIVVPTITPLNNDGSLDKPGLERLVDHLLQGGVSGIFLSGTTGEGPSLSYAIRREMIQNVCRQTAGHIPVIVAAMDSSQAETLALIEFAATRGAAAAAIAPPFYMALSEADILRYGKAVALESALPVYLYNVPSPRLPRFSLQNLRELCSIPNVIGFKDSGGDISFLRQAIEIFSSRPETSVFVGPEHLLLEAIRSGAVGGVSGGANIFPRLYMAMYRACNSHHWDLAARLQDHILQFQRDFYHVGEEESGLIRGLKAAGSALNICSP
ncbi:MAG TPA: dihydrodipicolinate synthase family protein, partial [Edaphobacter sp.]